MKKFIIGLLVVLFFVVAVFVYLWDIAEPRLSLKILGEEKSSYSLGDTLELEIVAKNHSFSSYKSRKDYFVIYVEETDSNTEKVSLVTYGMPELSPKDVVLSPFQSRSETISLTLLTGLKASLKPRYTVNVVEGINHLYVKFGDDSSDSNKLEINVDFKGISDLSLEELKCEHSSGDLCYYNLAKDTGDYSYCDEMEKGLLKWDCYIEKFTDMGDFSGCDYFDEGVSKSLCYRKAGEFLGDVSYCKKITSVDSNSLSHKKYCYAAVAE